MQGFVMRMVEEQQELQERIDKLDEFINGAKMGDLTDKEQDMMVDQYQKMIAYNDVLKARLKYYHYVVR